ncbi:hypothethical protein [Ralstonia solanacearum PSI07]|nr:hypothethical protein [Ralstonia solanacearum PSI07]
MLDSGQRNPLGELGVNGSRSVRGGGILLAQAVDQVWRTGAAWRVRRAQPVWNDTMAVCRRKVR